MISKSSVEAKPTELTSETTADDQKCYHLIECTARVRKNGANFRLIGKPKYNLNAC